MSGLQARVEQALKMADELDPGAFVEPKNFADFMRSISEAVQAGKLHLRFLMDESGQITNHDAWTLITILATRLELAARMMERLDRQHAEKG